MSFFFFFFFFLPIGTCRYLRQSFIFTGAIYIPTYIPINFPFFNLLPIHTLKKKKKRYDNKIKKKGWLVYNSLFFFCFHESQMEQQKK